MDKTTNMIILGTDDKVYTKSYTDYRSMQEAVGGNFEYFDQIKMKVQIGQVKKTINLDLICNEEFLFDSDIQVYNALTDRVALRDGIYGDVIVLIDNGDGSNKGFDKAEEKLFIDTVEDYIKDNKEKMVELHTVNDYNKQEPEYTFYEF